MSYNAVVHNRHSIRLPGFDYTKPGAYFLTILAHKKEHIFGKVVKGIVELSPVGEIVQEQWEKIPTHFPDILLDAFVIMPNHIHAVVVITERAASMGKGKAIDLWDDHKSNALPIRLGSQPGSIPAIVQNFKSITSRKINKLLNSPGSTIWHRII